MLDQKIKELIISKEPEPLVMIRILQGRGWYNTFIHNNRLPEHTRAAIIADYLGKEYGYGVRQQTLSSGKR